MGAYRELNANGYPSRAAAELTGIFRATANRHKQQLTRPVEPGKEQRKYRVPANKLP
jgi:hypothetical protein